MRKFILLLITTSFSVLSWSADYFWVGGSGDWNDLSHWATTSGGGTFHTTLPTASDNVFFDANSFTAASQTVTLTSSDKFCFNMNWTGVTNNPTFSIGAARMHVSGSLTLNTNMTILNTLTVNAGFYFEATTAGHTIQTFGRTLYYDVFFRGTGAASWTLLDALNAFDRIYFQGGTLNTNNNNITMVSSQGQVFFNRNFPTVFAGAPVVVNLGSSIITAEHLGTGDISTGVTINAGTSEMNLVTMAPADHNYHNVTFNGTAAVGFTTGGSSQTGTFNIIDVNSGSQFTLQGSRTITTALKFSAPGAVYVISSGSTTTINGNFDLPNSSCGPLSAIRASSTGSQATFVKSSGSVTGARLAIRDIAATGGATYTATSSIDEGNNSGWVFTPTVSQNFFWIGGTGDWNDGTQWSFTSGGPAANCVPAISDNVFFDANSFSGAGQTVSLVSGDKYCFNMSWAGVTNNPTLSIGAARIHVYGSLTLNTNMTILNTLTVNAGFYFEASTAGHTIQTFGRTLYYDVFFRGTGTASWTLLDAFNAFDRVHIQGGTLNTNNNNITMVSSQGQLFFSRDFPSTFNGAPVVVNLGSSVITAEHLGTNIISSGVTVNAGTSTFNLITMAPSDHNYHNVVFNGSANVGFTTGGSFHTGTYNNIDVNSGSQFTMQGNRTINGRLRFAAVGTTYLFATGSNTTINGDFDLPSSSCGALTAIRSASNGTQATITKPSGVVTGSRLAIRDMVATGGATFNANSSVDEGNNSGWNFTVTAPQNYFWIGGSGDWNDGTQWSFTTGGPAANCTPSLGDNVFFDANSFSAPGQTITLTSGDKYCFNMNWTGVTNNPTLSIGTARMHVYGSLTLNTNMTILNTLVVNAGFYFDANTGGHTISTFGRTLYYDVFFRGTGAASWTLLDALNAFDRIHLQGGTLNTNNHNITMVSSQGQLFFNRNFPTTFNGAPVVVNLGSSVITAEHLGTNIISSGVTVNAGTSTFNLVTMAPSDHNYHNVVFNGTSTVGFTTGGSSHTGTYNNIDVNSGTDFTMQGNRTINGRLLLGVPGLNASFSAGSTTNFVGSLESGGTTAQRVNIFSSVAGTPVVFQKDNGILCVEDVTLRDNTRSGASTFYASNSIDLGNNTGWVFTTTSCAIVLPVEITSFNASCNGGNVKFNWATASEQNSSHFEVQRQTSTGWITIGQVTAAGNSQSNMNYQFVAAGEKGGIYRLAAVDRDGSTKYTTQVIARCNRANVPVISPNPILNELRVEIPHNRTEDAVLSVINTSGQTVFSKKTKLSSTTNIINIDVSSMPAGTYLFQVRTADDVHTSRFVKL